MGATKRVPVPGEGRSQPCEFPGTRSAASRCRSRPAIWLCAIQALGSLPIALASALHGCKKQPLIAPVRDPEAGGKHGEQREARARATAEARGVGRGRLRPLLARPLRDRRLSLSDDAARRRRAEDAWTRPCERSPLAREEGIAVTPRGAGTSQSGQAINSGLVIDGSKYLNRLLSLDVAARRCVVEPGLVLDELNRLLKPHGLWFPVDVSTASRATIGGMAGNNSCGGRSLRYGTMRDNVVSIDAVLADGERMHFGPVAAGSAHAGVDAKAGRAHRAASRHRRARGRRGRGALSQGAAPRRRLQPRRALAECGLAQLGPYPRRLGRHARLFHRDRAQALARARQARARRLPFRLFPRGDGGGPAPRAPEADRHRARRCDDDRARLLDRHVPADARGLPARRAGSAARRRVRRKRGRESRSG